MADAADTRFKPGGDVRRASTGCIPGRPVLPGTVSKIVRQKLGKDVSAIVENVAVLARSGDPTGLFAAAMLLGAVMREGANTDHRAHENTESQKPA